MPTSGHFEDFINGLTEDASPVSGDFLMSYDTSASTLKKVDIDNLPSGSGGLAASGWESADAMAFVSVDDPTGVIDFTGDVRAKYSVGMRIKFTNATNTIFGIITDVNQTLQTGNTRVTFLHEIDPTDSLALYLMENSAITAPYYSVVKAPLGFPIDLRKWTVFVINTSLVQQLTPTAETWYNLGSISISIPIGVWKVSYQVFATEVKGSAINHFCSITLATANNNETDSHFNSGLEGQSFQKAAATLFREKVLALTSKTAYYLNMIDRAGNAPTGIYFDGAVSPTIIRAECVYL